MNRTPPDDEHAGSSNGSMSAASSLSLSTLVSHFVASKQSLSTTAHVHRASEIVNTARSMLESIAGLSAKNRFFRSSIDKQLTVLKTICQGLALVGQDSNVEFRDLIKRLDAADVNIKHATAELRDTMVDQCFRPAGEAPRSLLSFVDEHAVDGLNEAFRQSIDEVNGAQRTLQESNAALTNEIAQLETSLRDSEHASQLQQSGESDAHADADAPDTPAELFRSLESHATEMAELLQSLVKHYDLCITALRHTEGGAPAAQAALPGADADPALSPSALSPPPAPISPTERADLLAVLAADAAEVAPAARELTARAADMETSLVRLAARQDAQRAAHARGLAALSALSAISGRLPAYTRAAAAFAARWAAERDAIVSGLDELGGLCAFFGAFRRAYDGLLLEVARRLETRRRMDRIAADARAAIGRLYEAERAERDVFQADCGEFLPADLWPGFAEPPTRYDIAVVDDGTCNIPELPVELLKAARRRTDGK